MSVQSRSFQRFTREVQQSIRAYGKKKGYRSDKRDLFEFTVACGAARGHAVGEIIYKAIEFFRRPRKVLLVKIAGWAFLAWRHIDAPEN